MPQVTPQIILRADMIQPRRVPTSIITTFERLVNNVLQRLGFQIAIEFFETGWILFFCDMKDFRCYFGSPMVPKSDMSAVLPEPRSIAGAGNVTWDYTFVRLPPRPSEAVLARIIERFYVVNENLGKASFQILPDPDGRARYRVERGNMATYLASAETVVGKANDAFFAGRKTPSPKSGDILSKSA